MDDASIKMNLLRLCLVAHAVSRGSGDLTFLEAKKLSRIESASFDLLEVRFQFARNEISLYVTDENRPNDPIDLTAPLIIFGREKKLVGKKQICTRIATNRLAYSQPFKGEQAIKVKPFLLSEGQKQDWSWFNYLSKVCL